MPLFRNSIRTLLALFLSLVSPNLEIPVLSLHAQTTAAPHPAIPHPAIPQPAIPPPSMDGPPPLNAPLGPLEITEQRTLCAQPATFNGNFSEPPAAKLLNINALHHFSRGAGQKIAVIDTGVNPHSRLTKLSGGGDYVSSSTGLFDCDAHGTLVAGIIAAQPSSVDSFIGMAPEATIISIRQSSSAFSAKSAKSNSDNKIGVGYGTVQTLAYAVMRAVTLGATVINISEVACTSTKNLPNDQILGAAIKYAYQHNVVVVVAAGNLGESPNCSTQNPPYADNNPRNAWATTQTIASPAWFSPYVLAVGSVDSRTGAPSSFSLAGPWVSVAAPGTEIISLHSNNTRTLLNTLPGQEGPIPIEGTSFSTPYVSGLAALIRSRFPTLTAAQVITRIITTAHGNGNHSAALGFGVIDPLAALTDPLSIKAVPHNTPVSKSPSEPMKSTAGQRFATILVILMLIIFLALWLLLLPFRKREKFTD